MDFTLKQFGKNELKKNHPSRNSKTRTVSVNKQTVEEVIDILSNVECTCVWSSVDNQYIKVNDVPSEIVEELKMLCSLCQ